MKKFEVVSTHITLNPEEASKLWTLLYDLRSGSKVEPELVDELFDKIEDLRPVGGFEQHGHKVI